MAKTLYGMDLLNGLSAGTAKLARILGPNYGPNSRNTICDQKYDIPLIVNSGKKILPDFNLEDSVENLGAVILRDSILNADLSSGDGTIVSAILADTMIREGIKLIANGVSPVHLRKGIQKASAVVQQVIQQCAVPVSQSNDILSVATIASDSEEIGQMVADAFSAVGLEGIITVKDSQQTESRLDIALGIRYEYGLWSMTFANDEAHRSATMEKPYILLINQRVRHATELEKVLTETAQKNIPLCIIASDLDDEVLHFILANVNHGIVRVLAGHAPGHGDTRQRNMQALAAKTGAIVIDEECGLDISQCGLEVCGRADSVFMDKENTAIQGFPQENPQSVAHLRTYITSLLADANTPEKLEKLRLTLAMLSDGMATIYAGGYTDFEMFENKHLIENAVSAVYTAIRTGIVPGGGKTYLLAVPALDQLIKETEEDYKLGIQCVRKALLSPSKIIADNAGENGSYIISLLLEQIDKHFYGYNAAEHAFCDLKTSGIVDPMGTICTSFQIAAETAATLLTVQSAVLSDKK